MPVPIKLLCYECGDVPEKTVHYIMGGIVFRFCSQACCDKYMRRYTQVTISCGPEEQKQPAR